jgi:tetratricopeptide (TPR) repeat protein
MDSSVSERINPRSSEEDPKPALSVRFLVLGMLPLLCIGDADRPLWAAEQSPGADTNVNPTVDRWIAGEASLMELLENSRLIYLLDTLPDSELLEPNPEIGLIPMGCARRIDRPDGTITLKENFAPEQVWRAVNDAESLFAAGEYDMALDEYRAIWRQAPEYVTTLTVMGNAFYAMGRYDSALAYFRAAIDSNFIDYHAHWFLADALMILGDTAAAVDELTLAHVLNACHRSLFLRLVQVREQIGRPWARWSFQPRYRDKVAADTVHLYLATGWIAYGLIKAALMHEPGVFESATAAWRGKKARETAVEEIAIHYWIGSPDSDSALASRVRQIRDEGELATMIWYEIFARNNPRCVWALPRPAIEQLVQYVRRYH